MMYRMNVEILQAVRKDRTANRWSFTKAIIEQAYAAADQAARSWIDQQGDVGTRGYAVVNVQPTRSILGMLLANQYTGQAGVRKGVDVWNPGRIDTQCMEARGAAAEAFTKTLTDAGFNATMTVTKYYTQW
jgi:hypothetical protein